MLRTLFVHLANREAAILLNDVVHFLFQCIPDRGSRWSLCIMNICSPILKHYARLPDTGRVHNTFAINCNKFPIDVTESNIFRLQKPAPHSQRDLQSACSFSQLVTLTTWIRSAAPTASGNSSTPCWTQRTNDQLQRKSCTGCMRKCSLLSECPSYVVTQNLCYGWAFIRLLPFCWQFLVQKSRVL